MRTKPKETNRNPREIREEETAEKLQVRSPGPLDDPSGGAWEVLPLVDLAVEAGVVLGMLGVSPYVGVSSSDAGLRAGWLSFAPSEAISPPGAPAEYLSTRRPGEPQNTDLRLGDQSLQRPSGPPAGSNTAGPAGTHPPHRPHSPTGPAEHTQELFQGSMS
ncbi:unnamed protein product [Boreogadus saida]